MELIDYQDARPIYEQIVENFKMQILKGVLEPDEQMPSVRNLAMELSTNPNTIQKAYTVLEGQGFIYTVKVRGNFVSGDESLKEAKKTSPYLTLSSHHEIGGGTVAVLINETRLPRGKRLSRSRYS